MYLVGPRWEQVPVSFPSCLHGLAFAAPRSSALPSTPLASPLLLLLEEEGRDHKLFGASIGI